MPNQVEAAGGVLSGRGALSVLSASLPGQYGPSPRPLAGRGAGARPYMRAWHIVDTNHHFETQVSDRQLPDAPIKGTVGRNTRQGSNGRRRPDITTSVNSYWTGRYASLSSWVYRPASSNIQVVVGNCLLIENAIACAHCGVGFPIGRQAIGSGERAIERLSQSYYSRL